MAYTEDETLEGVLYSEELWEGLLPNDTADNEFFLPVVDPEASIAANPVVFTSSSQVSDAAPHPITSHQYSSELDDILDGQSGSNPDDKPDAQSDDNFW